MVQVEVVLSQKSYPEAFKVWDVLVSNYLDELAEVNVVDGFSGKVIKFYHVSDYLLKSKADSFFIELLEGSIEFAYISGMDFSRLDIKNLAISKESAEKWLSSVLNEPAFVQARLYDGEYDRWQNMEDISYYESEKREHSHLPKKSNGLPFPLESEVIDISGNPGRWELRKGYIESIGSTMWVNKALLSNLGVEYLSLKNDGFCQLTDFGQVLKLEVQENCFSVAKGEEAEIQKLLRKELFNQ